VARSRRTGGPGEAGPRWPLRDSPLALAAGLGAAGLGVALFAGGVWWSRRRSLPRDARPILCRVSQAGLSYQTPSVDQVVRWEAYERFVETPNLFVVGRPGGEFRLLPKRAFPDNEVRRRFTLLLSRKLPTVRNVV
jgi:hypothetical protein